MNLEWYSIFVQDNLSLETLSRSWKLVQGGVTYQTIRSFSRIFVSLLYVTRSFYSGNSFSKNFKVFKIYLCKRNIFLDILMLKNKYHITDYSQFKCLKKQYFDHIYAFCIVKIHILELCKIVNHKVRMIILIMMLVNLMAQYLWLNNYYLKCDR